MFEAVPKVSLPEGATQIRFNGCKGVKLAAGRFMLKPHVWFGETGLCDEVKRLHASGTPVVVAMNGAFYGKEGPLGQVIVDGVLPSGLRQMPAHLSRCFIAWVEANPSNTGSTSGRWLLGETAARPQELASFPTSLACASFSQPLAEGETIRHLLGGGGWIIREGRDVHMDAYNRQKFRFRKVDQDSRHSVVALDGKGALFMLVFETGLNLSAVSNLLLTRTEFKGITDAVFFDGGSSSTIVAGDDYLVSPLYFIDKARFTALVAVPAKK